jgi:DNA polymerase III subunit epsilon
MTATLFCDVETTGLVKFNRPSSDQSQPHLVQIAAVLCDQDGVESETMVSIVKPWGWTIPPEVVAVHGITTERALAEGLPHYDVMAAFAALHDAADWLVCYGIGFDTKVLRAAYHRAGMDPRYRPEKEWCAQRAAARWCKLAATDRMVEFGRGREFKTPKLGEAYEMLFGEPLVKAHDALEDVRALKRIVIELRKRLGRGEAA